MAQLASRKGSDGTNARTPKGARPQRAPRSGGVRAVSNYNIA